MQGRDRVDHCAGHLGRESGAPGSVRTHCRPFQKTTQHPIGQGAAWGCHIRLVDNTWLCNLWCHAIMCCEWHGIHTNTCHSWTTSMAPRRWKTSRGFAGRSAPGLRRPLARRLQGTSRSRCPPRYAACCSCSLEWIEWHCPTVLRGQSVTFLCDGVSIERRE